jgi:pimeloyl-ACP methyl ester carboxylesterase
MKQLFLLAITFLVFLPGRAQPVEYPYPVKYLSLDIEGGQHKMAYMDVPPAILSAQPRSHSLHGRTVVLFHGKNFNGYYWKDVIAALSSRGYRVIVPDQLGFGKSDKPNIHYSFALLAANTKKLLDTLGLTTVSVVGHSMGGMLATRFVLMFPAAVEKLVYENPIGLEDYRLFVPYQSVDQQYAAELKSDYNALKTYQQSYYPQWKPEYEQYVQAQYDAMQIPGFNTAALASALTYDMIYQQPVVYEFKHIKPPTLIIIGQVDRTVVGKKLVNKSIVARYGQYPQLGKSLQNQIRGSVLAELPGVGHIPHIQAFDSFSARLLNFLAQ